MNLNLNLNLFTGVGDTTPSVVSVLTNVTFTITLGLWLMVPVAQVV
jgi:hypothetical protein